MITKYMTLTTTRDADQWASDMVEGISCLHYDYDQAAALLSNWLWNNKPFVGCTYGGHPIAALSDEQFWDLLQPAELYRSQQRKRR